LDRGGVYNNDLLIEPPTVNEAFTSIKAGNRTGISVFLICFEMTEKTSLNDFGHFPEAILFLPLNDPKEINALETIENYWSISVAELTARLGTGSQGLDEKSALERIREQRNQKTRKNQLYKKVASLLSQYKSPLVLILVFASGLALALGEYSDSIIVLVILLLSGLLSYIQERKANEAVEKLKALVRNKVLVKRQGQEIQVDAEEVVQGDIIILDAGDIIPADAVILQSNDLHVNEAILTGESFPSEKSHGSCPEATPISERKNVVFKGTNVINGSATVVAVYTTMHAEFDKIASSVSGQPSATAFEKGIRKFGFLLMRIAVIIALLILVINILLRKPVIDSMLFTLALAVGMTPELLPAIITITLSKGAKRMADKKVIVKKLAAIQNLGEMDILCCDKTGTLTEGTVKVHSAVGYNGCDSDRVLQYAYLNAFFESGFSNPIDEALKKTDHADISGFNKTDEIPYDFLRKRLSVVLEMQDRHILITKGAFVNVLKCCSEVETETGIEKIGLLEREIERQFSTFSENGLRTIAVAYKNIDGNGSVTKEDESGMVFLGFIALFDPPKKDINQSLRRLQGLGIRLKLISGDNVLVVKHLSDTIGFPISEIITGADLLEISEDALLLKVNQVDVFAEIEPVQKERIIRALQKAGHAVGFLGDGINDAGAIKAADVGISVDCGSDIAKEVADIVLLDKSIDVIKEGIMEGRRTFMNTLKYIFVTTSANFGNMLSMAAASLWLPFLPLLADQVLLNNFLSDIPALAIGNDNVDSEALRTPKRWSMGYIQRFMVVFGLQSSLFDVLTFVVLLRVFRSDIPSFRTAWFTESLITQVLILLVIRTRLDIWKSRPGRLLLIMMLTILLLAVFLSYLPVSRYFELSPLRGGVLSAVLIIAFLYIASAELIKRFVLRVT
jgi:Mg2+-importing ATPase